MLRTCLLVLLGGAVCGGSSALGAGSQGANDEEHDVLELRITQVRGTQIVVDRGALDLVKVGDMVFFKPREGGLYGGIVVQVDQRTSTVELQGPTFPAAPGTRGFVRIPKARSAPQAPVKSKTKAAPTPETPEHPEWTNRDEEYKQGQPLLAKVRPLRPEERPKTLTGRWYTSLDQIKSTEDDRTDAFYRVGGSAEFENLTGVGDRLHIDGELNYRDTTVPDNDDQTAKRLRLDRLSYSFGGTRFAPERVELGRFLHDGMPEFGVIDGAEWNTRAADGDRYGVSAGFMPEPDLDMESGKDFELSAFYRWVFDDSERLTAAAGFQKTWHNSNADRDLVVSRVAYLPRDAWNFVGSMWVDLYTSGDNAKGAGPEITQALFNLSRSWDDGYSCGFRASRIRFPEIDRHEYTPVLAADLADARVDRVSTFAATKVTAHSRLRGELGWWQDEDDSGGDAQLALTLDDMLVDDGQLELAGFGSDAQFSDGFGARASLRRWSATGGWSLDYELANNNIVGFSADNDDLPQHRFRAQWDWFGASDWSLTTSLEAAFWDGGNSLIGRVYLQRSF